MYILTAGRRPPAAALSALPPPRPACRRWTRKPGWPIWNGLDWSRSAAVHWRLLYIHTAPAFRPESEEHNSWGGGPAVCSPIGRAGPGSTGTARSTPALLTRLDGPALFIYQSSFVDLLSFTNLSPVGTAPLTPALLTPAPMAQGPWAQLHPNSPSC